MISFPFRSTMKNPLQAPAISAGQATSVWMKRSLSCFLLIGLSSATGCGKNPCIENRDYPGCASFEPVLRAGRMQAYRNLDGAVVFTVDNLDIRGDAFGTATLSLDLDPGHTLTQDDCDPEVKGVPNACHSVTDILYIRQDENMASPGLLLRGVSARGGFFTLTAPRLGLAPRHPYPVLLYTPPNLSDPKSVVLPFTYAPESKKNPVSLVLLPAASGSPSSGLFVTEQDSTLFVSALSRYTYDSVGHKLVKDGAFNQAVIFDGPEQFLGRFAIDLQSVLIYQYRQLAPTGHFITPMDLVAPYAKKNSQQMDDQPLAEKNIQLLASDPNTAQRWVATDKKLSVFTMSYSDAVYRTGPSLKLSPGLSLRYLAARHYDLKNPQDPTEQFSWDAVGINQENQLQFYHLDGSNLRVHAELSAAANQAAAAVLGNSNVVGLSVADIDQDGYPDVILALQDRSTKQTQEIGWLRYIGHGTFAPLDRLTTVKIGGLPLQNVSSLAVGDVDFDGQLDVALSTPTSVHVYLNRAK